MKLKLKNSPDPATTKALQRAFKATTEALWIDNYAVEVHTEIAPADVKVTTEFSVEHGKFQRVEITGGYTEDRLTGNVVKVKLFSLNKYFLIHTFIHELVHVAQMLRGELSRVNGVAYWKGRAYPEPQTQAEYEDLPWEREARVMSDRIMRRLG